MILGIDIAQEKFDRALYQGKELVANGQFANNAAGFKKLSQWLNPKTAGQVKACLEATGRYGDALALSLYQAGHQVSLVNPARIKQYAQSQLQRTKTDKLDEGNNLTVMLPDNLVGAPAHAFKITPFPQLIK